MSQKPHPFPAPLLPSMNLTAIVASGYIYFRDRLSCENGCITQVVDRDGQDQTPVALSQPADEKATENGEQPIEKVDFQFQLSGQAPADLCPEKILGGSRKPGSLKKNRYYRKTPWRRIFPTSYTLCV